MLCYDIETVRKNCSISNSDIVGLALLGIEERLWYIYQDYVKEMGSKNEKSGN
jgi:hypothetical protein